MVGHRCDLLEDPFEVGVRVFSLAADVLYHGVKDGAAPACFFSADEEPVFCAELEGAYGVFDFVVVECEVSRAEGAT